MKLRRALMVPPVLLASGCVARPWTPGVAVATWAPPAESTALDLPARDDVLRRWQLPPADPWTPYAKYTLLTALDVRAQHVELPDVGSLVEVARAAFAGRVVGENGFPEGTLFVVDMRGAASVAFGVALSRAARHCVSLVPTFNNWPGQDELVPAEETLAALVTMSPRATDGTGETTTPVFLLDAWRLAYRFDEPGEDTYDNRYILAAADLPDVGELRARGIQRLVYVVESLDETSVEEDDVHSTFLAWQTGGIPIAMVDLDRLVRPILQGEWGDVFVENALVVQPRVTILDDPSFYVRARGGFGGIHARPSPVWGGGAWLGHGGYAGHGGGGWHGGGG